MTLAPPVGVVVRAHDQERPFPRCLAGMRLMDGVTTVTVRATRDVHGFGGREGLAHCLRSGGGDAVHRRTTTTKEVRVR